MFRAAFFAAFFPFVSTAHADDVTLTSRDGAIEISGKLLAYDGEFYRIDTIYGPLTLDGSAVACAGMGCPDLSAFVAELRISGAAAMADVLLPSLIESFAGRRNYAVKRRVTDGFLSAFELTDRTTDQPVMRVTFRATRSDEGFADLVAGEADIAMSLREARAAEVALARDAGQGDLRAAARSRIVALDALVPVVASDARVDALSFDQLMQVVAGEITNWQALGGPDAPIALHLPSPGDGAMQHFVDRFLQPAALRVTATATRHDTARALAEAVSADPLALGLGMFSQVGRNTALPFRGTCGFETRATALSLKTEDYPMTSPLFLYLAAHRLPPLVRAFLDDLAAPAAAGVIRRAGYVDQRISEVGLNNQGLRLANAIQSAGGEVGIVELSQMAKTLRAAKRLSIAFRFEGGASKLDTQSRANVRLLSRAIEDGLFDGRKLLFVGFTDGEGPAAGNQQLARSRAAAVRDAVQNAAQLRQGNAPDLRVIGFGEAMPLACDDSELGRAINRRVEMWIE